MCMSRIITHICVRKDDMTINQRLFQILDERGIKQADLAKALNIRTSVIGNWKTRGTDPPAEYILHICEFLRISVYELLGDNVDTIDSIENIYAKLDPTDKQVVDIIFDKYREENAELSSSKIG